MTRKASIAIVLCLLCISFPASASPPTLLAPADGATVPQCIDYGDYLHWVGGVVTAQAFDVAISGTHAYVASPDLQVIDSCRPISIVEPARARLFCFEGAAFFTGR